MKHLCQKFHTRRLIWIFFRKLHRQPERATFPHSFDRPKNYRIPYENIALDWWCRYSLRLFILQFFQIAHQSFPARCWHGYYKILSRCWTISERLDYNRSASIRLEVTTTNNSRGCVLDNDDVRVCLCLALDALGVFGKNYNWTQTQNVDSRVLRLHCRRLVLPVDRPSLVSWWTMHRCRWKSLCPCRCIMMNVWIMTAFQWYM